MKAMTHYIQKMVALVMLLLTSSAVMAGDIKILTSTYGTLTITEGATGSGSTYSAEAGATVKLKLTGNMVNSRQYVPDKVVGMTYFDPSGAGARRRSEVIGVDTYDIEITDIAADGTCSFTMPAGKLTVELEPIFKVKTIIIDGNNSTVSGIATSYEYTGLEQKPVPTVVFNNGGQNETLKSGQDYNVTYSDNVNAGTATVTITMTDLYEGELTKTFEITKKATTITAKAQTIAYSDPIDSSTEQVTATGLIDGHTVSAVTLTASDTKGGETGTVTPSDAKIMNGSTDVTANYAITYTAGTLTVDKKSIANATVTMTPTAIVCGESAPTLTVMDGQNQLVEDRDFTLQWQDSTGKTVEIASAEPGTYTAVLEGKDNYTGTLVVSQKLTIALNEDQKAASAVNDLIDAIGDVSYPESADDIEAAREAYEKLTDEQKALIPDDKKALLEKAEEDYTEKEEQAKTDKENEAEAESVTEEEAKKELDDAIKAAEELYESIKDDPDKQDIAEELKKAIEEAKKTAEDGGSSKLDDVAAKNALDKAKDKAEAETVTEEEAEKKLDDAIKAAEELYNEIKDDPDKQDIAEELKKAIEEAKKTAEDGGSSKLDDVAAKNDLEKALERLKRRLRKSILRRRTRPRLRL